VNDPDGRRVVVIGGGLAGITAALDCADAGARVTLVEVRRRLGGAIYSFERDGLQIDNGQHVFLRCYTAYLALLARLGSARHVELQPRFEIPVLSPGTTPTVLRRGRLPAPLHLAGALARYRRLTLAQRLRAARAGLALMRLDPNDRALDRLTLGDWLAAHGQDSGAVSALWDLIALPALNLPAAEGSLALGAFVFRTGLFSDAGAGDMGFHSRALGETIGEPAGRALREAGVDVRLGWRARRLVRTGAGIEIQGGGAKEQGGEEAPDRGEGPARSGAGEGISAEAAIVAVQHARAATLLGELEPDVASGLRALGSSPIVNLHVIYDRQVCAWPFAAGVGTPVQYLFDRTTVTGVSHGCQYLAVSLSGAEQEMRMSVDALRERYLPALRELLPRAREAKLERFFVTREHAATFRATPGVAALRPRAETSVPGLLLAGTWTDTGWPATLESAVLSGHAAAARALARVRLREPVPAAGVAS
jgi:squalene-associated FAD-dependent desaturase